MAITQNNRLVQVDSPLGGDVLLLQSMDGSEELGRLFHYELDLTSEDRAIRFDQLLGKPMGLTLELYDGAKRYFHGIVCSCRQLTGHGQFARSEEHTSELQSLMRISYAVFCLKKKKQRQKKQYQHKI